MLIYFFMNSTISLHMMTIYEINDGSLPTVNAITCPLPCDKFIESDKLISTLNTSLFTLMAPMSYFE